MTQPLDRRRALASLWALVGAAALPSVARAQDGFGLVQLMQLLAQVKAGEASFTEKRAVAMLDRTLESSGKLSFEAPDTFVRETLKPRHERLAVAGNMVTMSQGQRSRTVPLDSVPEAAVIVEAIRGTLTGNREAIERNFSATVSGSAARWTLELVPRVPRLRELVISVRVTGQQARVREIVIAMADGDRSVMSITPPSGS
jgi:outer membrane lipoprotein-sorting protein